MPKEEMRTRGPARTEALGRALGARLEPGDVVALEGPLGAGKTTLVRGIVAGRGGDPDRVASPTYVLARRYDVDVVVWHLDAYRLEGPRAFAGLDPDLYVGPEVITVVEWADRVADELPEELIRVRMDHAGEDERAVVVSAPGAILERLTPAITAFRAEGEA